LMAKNIAKIKGTRSIENIGENILCISLY